MLSEKLEPEVSHDNVFYREWVETRMPDSAKSAGIPLMTDNCSVNVKAFQKQNSDFIRVSIRFYGGENVRVFGEPENLKNF